MPETIQARELPLLDVFSDKYVFNIPPYQRPYAWTTDETGELFDDIMYAMNGYEQVDDTPPYFLGSIVIIKSPDESQAEVVDGQQRLTTLTILLCVLRDLSAGDMKEEIDSYVRQRGMKSKGTTDIFRITLRELDEDFFRKTIQMPHKLQRFLKEGALKRTDSRQRMFENAELLWKKLSKLNDDERDRLVEFIIRRCFLVIVSASDRNSAYRIFKVMNDRGLDLSPTDILKAEIIGAMDDSYRTGFTNKWESIEEELGRDDFRDLFAHIRMIYMKDKARGSLNQEFSDNVLNGKSGGLDDERAKHFVEKVLTPYADSYEVVTRAGYESTTDSDTVNSYLQHLGRLDNFDWVPPAMVFFRRNMNRPKRLTRFIRDLERLAYSMFIRRANINERIRRYADVLHAIERSEELFDDAAPLQLKDRERAELLKVLGGPIYSLPRVPRPLLLRLDSLLAEEGASYNYSTISIEHVLPQNPKSDSLWLKWFPDEEERAQWTDRIANLVLLSHRKNSQAQNYDFEEKKSKYFQRKSVAHFALTTQVLSKTKWDLGVLKRRQRNLISALKEEWRLG